MNRKFILPMLLLTSFGFGQSARAQQPIHARTDSGKEVLLYPDGTWKYSAEPSSNPPANDYTKSASAQKVSKPKRGDFAIWYDGAKWKLTPDKLGEDKPLFELIGEDGYALVIAEGISMPVSSLRAAALENAKSVATDVRVLSEENRMVNGTEVLCMKFSLTKDQIPLTFFGYYYGGKQGAIQVVTYTGQNLFEKYQREFTNFLNGLEIH